MKSLVFGLFFVLFAIQDSIAQGDVALVRTNSPDAYTLEFIDDVEQQGVARAQELFSELGLSSPQYDSMFSMYISLQGELDDRWSTVIGAVENAGALT
ncbi:MAG: hypothetical protein ABNH53_15995 [Henriciella sp.]|jgi:hypothetical protein